MSKFNYKKIILSKSTKKKKKSTTRFKFKKKKKSLKDEEVGNVQLSGPNEAFHF